MLELQKAGFSVSVDYFHTNWLPQIKKVDGLKKRFWPLTYPLFYVKKRWRKEQSLWHLLFNYFFPPDLTIINMSGHLSPYTFKLAKILQGRDKPYIAMIGGLNMSFDAKSLNYYNNAHHIIVHTKTQKQMILSQKGFQNFDVRIMPLGVDTEVFKPKKQLSGDVVKLLFVGRLTRLKQIELCIESLNYIVANSNIRACLRIVGPISDSAYYTELTDLVRQLKLDDIVTFEGAIPHDDLLPVYQESSLLLLPSTHESFGMVITESMACATPVVALYGSGGPEEIITNGVDGVLCNPSNYPIEILNLVNNRQGLAVMSKNARKTVENNYSSYITNKVLRDSVESVL